MKKALWILFALSMSGIAAGQVRTSVQNGRFDGANSWDCACIPSSTDSLVINHTIRFANSETVNVVTINNGGRLNVNNGNSRINGDLTINTGGIVNNNSRLDAYGNYYNDGVNQGSGRLRLRGNNTTIDGSGVVNNTDRLMLMNGNKNILASANLTVADRIQLNNLITVTNNGYITCGVLGGNGNRTWINAANSTLRINTSINAALNVQANADGNTVTYGRLGTSNVTLHDPVNSRYFNLIIDGDDLGSRKRLRATTEVLGDLTIEGSTFDVRSSGTDHSLSVGGNWVQNGGDFNERAGLVTLNGSGNQSISGISNQIFNDLTIAGSGIKTMNVGLLVENDLSVSSTLDVGIASNNLTVTGDFDVTGSFEPREGLALLNGNAIQTITGGVKFHDLTIDNSSTGVELSTGNYELEGTLSLNDGNLNTNNLLTLLSDATGTARIAAITNGSISGDITMQRYVSSGPATWRFLSTPVSGITLEDWNDDFVTSGFTGSDFPSFSFTSIYTYNEATAGTFDNGYTAAGNITDNVAVGSGIWVYAADPVTGGSPFTIDVTGPANTGNVSLPVTYTDDASQPASQDGWNMVGNPYPSNINWDDPDWTKLNVNNAIYIWDANALQYAAYVNGVGTNGGSANIASSQAFWVQTNGTNPALTAREGVKTSNAQRFLRKKAINNKLKIQLVSKNGYSDETYVRIQKEATMEFDNAYDAAKLFSSYESVPTILTKFNGKDFAINAVPAFNEDLTIPVQVKVNQSGYYTLMFDNHMSADKTACIVLEDLTDGKMIDLSNVKSYECFISDTTKAPRFLLHLGALPVNEVVDVSCNGSADGTILVKGSGEGPWNYEVKDGSDAVIANIEGATSERVISDLAAGIYNVFVTNSGHCGDVNQLIEIGEPEAVVAKFEVNSEFNYVGDSVKVVNASENAENYFWDFGDGTISEEENPVHQYANAGSYEIQLVASNGNAACEVKYTQQVSIEQRQIETRVDELSDLKNLNVYGDGQTINVKYTNTESGNVLLTINNLLGQQIFERNYGRTDVVNDRIQLEDISGIVLVNVDLDGERKSFKLVLTNGR